MDKRDEALKIIQAFNGMRNDLDAYLYDIAEWGLGKRKDKPKKEDFGLAQDGER